MLIYVPIGPKKVADVVAGQSPQSQPTSPAKERWCLLSQRISPCPSERQPTSPSSVSPWAPLASLQTTTPTATTFIATTPTAAAPTVTTPTGEGFKSPDISSMPSWIWLVVGLGALMFLLILLKK